MEWMLLLKFGYKNAMVTIWTCFLDLSISLSSHLTWGYLAVPL